jgi:hypothetical protein
MSFFPENLKLMSSVGADERDAPAISVRNAEAAVALYAIASRDRCRLTGEWLRNAYADFMDNSGYPWLRRFGYIDSNCVNLCQQRSTPLCIICGLVAAGRRQLPKITCDASGVRALIGAITSSTAKTLRIQDRSVGTSLVLSSHRPVQRSARGQGIRSAAECAGAGRCDLPRPTDR